MPEEEKEYNPLAKIIKAEYMLLIIVIIVFLFIISIVAKERALYMELSKNANQTEEMQEQKSIPENKTANKNGPILNESKFKPEDNNSLAIESLISPSFDGKSQSLLVKTNLDSECIHSSDEAYSNPKKFDKKVKAENWYTHSAQLALEPDKSYRYYILCLSGSLSSSSIAEFSVGNSKMPKSSAMENGKRKIGAGFYFGLIVLVVLAIDLVLLTFRIYKKMVKEKQTIPKKGSSGQKLSFPYAPRQLYPVVIKRTAVKIKPKPIAKATSKPEEEYIKISELEKRLEEQEKPAEGKNEEMASREAIFNKLRQIAGKKK